MENEEEERYVPGLLRLDRDGKITRFQVAQGEQDIPPSKTSTICSKDILLQPHNLKARLYLPTACTDPASSSSSSSSPPLLPLILFFHGGGFVSLSPSTPGSHSFCTHLSIQAHSIILSVAYRLAPEHRLPAAFDDGFSSLLWLKSQSRSTFPHRDPWLASHADFAQIFLAGVSSGASIAHHVALQASQQDVHVAGLVLVVPFLGGQMRTRSELELAESSSLPLEGCDACWALSLPLGANRDHPFSNVVLASQKFWADKSTPWPPSLVVIGGKDILRDRQLEYVQQLRATGRDVIVYKFDNADHFMSGAYVAYGPLEIIFEYRAPWGTHVLWRDATTPNVGEDASHHEGKIFRDIPRRNNLYSMPDFWAEAAFCVTQNWGPCHENHLA